MKHLYLTLFTFLIFTQAFAQKDFRSGYIVQNHDTVRGYVDYRGAVRNSKTTTFKPTLDAAEQSFTPAQLAGYGFEKESKAYESKTIPATEAQAEQQLFLRTLVKGKASLYTYRDDHDQERFYLSKDEGALVELKQTTYNRKDPKSGKTVKMVDQHYLGMLGSAFYDCSDLKQERLESVMLRASTLIKIANDYNQCMGSTQYIQEPKKTTVAILPVISYSLPSLHFSGNHRYSRGDYQSTGLGLGGGLAMHVANPSMSEKLSFVLELLYASYRFEGEIKDDYYTGRRTNYDLLFDLHYLKLPAQLRYTFPKGKVRPFVNVGASYSYAIHSKRVENKFSTFHNTSYSDEGEALPGSAFKRHMFGAVAGAGILYPIQNKTLFLETRYETMDGIAKILSLPSSIKSLSLQLGYSF